MTTSSPAAPREKSTSVPAILGRVAVLSLTLAAAVYLVPLLIKFHMWAWLVIVLLAAAAIFALYSTKRFIPGKYLFPGTFFLAVFLIVPIVMTVQTSFTNFGDGFRDTKEEAITTITNNSVVQAPDSPIYNLTVATTGSATGGPFILFLVDTGTNEVLRGSDGETVQKVDPSTVTVENGFVTKADGYTILSNAEVNSAYSAITGLTVPVSESTTVKVQGVKSAFEATRTMVYDKATDSITNTKTGDVYFSNYRR